MDTAIFQMMPNNAGSKGPMDIVLNKMFFETAIHLFIDGTGSGGGAEGGDNYWGSHGRTSPF
jgi:hypothetical protein